MTLRPSHPLRAMLVCLAACAVGFAFIGTAWSNPIAPQNHAYIDAEKLKVTTRDDAAEISGVFKFRAIGEDVSFLKDTSVTIDIPVWIPASPQTGDATVGAFLKAYPLLTSHALDCVNVSAWDAAIGLKFRVGKKDITPSYFRVVGPGDLGPAWHREGYACVLVTVIVPPRALDSGLFGRLPETVITYRQPLLKKPDAKTAEFFYVPTFANLPKDKSTSSIRRYSMHLKNTTDGLLTLGEDKVAPGSSAVLPLAHHQPIVFQVVGR